MIILISLKQPTIFNDRFATNLNNLKLNFILLKCLDQSLDGIVIKLFDQTSLSMNSILHSKQFHLTMQVKLLKLPWRPNINNTTNIKAAIVYQILCYLSRSDIIYYVLLANSILSNSLLKLNQLYLN